MKVQVDLPALRKRLLGILLAPQEEWVRTIAEPGDPRTLAVPWVAALAALLPFGLFVAGTLVGVGHVFPDRAEVTVRNDFMSGVLLLVGSYAAMAAAWAGLALLVEALAPTFEARQDREASFKLATYALTPFWIAGALALLSTAHGFFTAIFWLGLALGAGWSWYLLATGLPVLLGAPDERSPVFAAVAVIAVAIGGGAALNLLFALLGPTLPTSH